MGLPSVNQSGYETSSVLSHTSTMKGKILLVHGLIDENVHFRHTGKTLQHSCSNDSRVFVYFFFSTVFLMHVIEVLIFQFLSNLSSISSFIFSFLHSFIYLFVYFLVNLEKYLHIIYYLFYSLILIFIYLSISAPNQFSDGATQAIRSRSFPV